MEIPQLLRLTCMHLGVPPINDINDVEPTANVLRELWEPCRDDVFGESPFQFCFAQVPLVLSTVDIKGWAYSYVYPESVARVWYVYNELNIKKKDAVEYEKRYDPVQGIHVISTNEAEAYADASYIVESPSLWDAKFCMAFALRLAAGACPFILSDDKKTAQLSDMYVKYINEAKRVGFAENRRKPYISTGLIDARG